MEETLYTLIPRSYAPYSLSELAVNNSSVSKLVWKGLDRLAEATWGYEPGGKRKYCLSREGWDWWAEQSYVQKTRHFFRISVDFNEQGAPASFTVWHGRGRIRTNDVSETALGLALKEASRAGPAVEG